jgi:hypothetical protein
MHSATSKIKDTYDFKEREGFRLVAVVTYLLTSRSVSKETKVISVALTKFIIDVNYHDD